MPKRRANGEGSIYKRKDGLWAATYTDNAGKRRTLYGKTQQIVKDKLKGAINQSDNGLSMDKDKMTFAEWLIEWLDIYCKPPILKESSYAMYYNAVHNHIIPAFPKVLLKDLRADMLQKFFNNKITNGRLDTEIDKETGEKKVKSGGLSLETLYRYRAVIIVALNHAVEDKILIHNVAYKVKLPKKDGMEKRALTMDEQQRLIDASLKCNNWLALAIPVALHTGMRMGEILSLKVEDINFEAKELYIRRTLARVKIPDKKRWEIIIGEPKTIKSKRTIPLTDFITEVLRRQVEAVTAEMELLRQYANEIDLEGNEKWLNENYIFISLYGKPHEHSTLQALFYRLMEQEAIPHINFHALRHTFATRCIEAGFNVKTLSDILGLTDVKITLSVYTHALEEQKRSSMKMLETLYSKELES